MTKHEWFEPDWRWMAKEWRSPNDENILVSVSVTPGALENAWSMQRGICWLWFPNSVLR